MADLFVGLVHYPIYNKRMQVIATAVTNFDIHDIARTARTYDVKKYFLIHPHNAQKEIITGSTALGAYIIRTAAKRWTAWRMLRILPQPLTKCAK